MSNDYLITKPFDLERQRMVVAGLLNEKSTIGKITK